MKITVGLGGRLGGLRNRTLTWFDSEGMEYDEFRRYFYWQANHKTNCVIGFVNAALRPPHESATQCLIT